MTGDSRGTHRARRAALVLAATALLAAAFPVAAGPGSVPGGAPIDPRAWAEVAKGADGTVWVLLREEADLSPAFSMTDWDARGTWVHETLRATADRTQRGLLRMLAARGVDATPFFIVNAVALRGADEATVRAVAARSEVGRIEGDPKAFVAPTVAADPVPPVLAATSGDAGVLATEWGISAIRAPSVWSTFGVRGEGVVVGTIDTGVAYTHPALLATYRGNLGGSFSHDYDWYDPTGTCTAAPCDNNGHGTHTMGTIVGEDGSNVIGVAPKARWIAAKGCATSSCASNALLSAGQWMLAPTNLRGRSANASLRPHLVSNSWGSSDGASTVYQKMVDSWVASGIFPIFSNGNSGSACRTVGSPGSYLASYGVGAYDSSGRIADFSSRGPSPFSGAVKPDISAPGVAVRSAWPGGGYQSLNGTSMAAPHVAGTVALMLSAAPALIGKLDEIRAALDGSTNVSGTDDRTCGGTAADNNVWGRGKLDALQAVTDSPRGATGTLAGRVTDASSGAGIAGATVSVSGSFSRTVTSDATGAYSLLVPVGSYTLTASKFAYANASASGLAVSSATTTTRNVSLSPVATTTLSGAVTGPTGAAVAGASVAVSAPLPAATTTSGGGYSIGGLPAGTYALTVTPTDPCLATTTQNATVGSSPTTANVAVPYRNGGGYVCSSGTATFVPGTSGRLGIGGDDAYGTVALPFSFTYYGRQYTSLYVSTNGFLSFVPLTSSHFGSSSIPSATAPNGVYPFWTDLVIDSNAGIHTATIGSTVGSRRFVVEWRNAAFYAYGGRVTFGVVLSEATGEVLLQYGALGTADTSLGTVSTVGIEKPDGSAGLLYSFRTKALTSGLTISFRP